MAWLRFFAFLSGASAFRTSRKKLSGWSSNPASSYCVDLGVAKLDLGTPMYFPVVCSGDATNVKITVIVDGYISHIPDAFVDGEKKQGSWPNGIGWNFTVGSLSAGSHSIFINDPWIIHEVPATVTLQGDGASCSFDAAPNTMSGLRSETYTGLDALNRLYGPDRDFSAQKKQQLYFSQATMGTNVDGSISSSIMTEGWWTWLFSYTQDNGGDPWGNRLPMWDESNLGPPYPEVSLDHMIGRSGQKMQVAEPCNTLSNWVYHDAAVWISCKAQTFSFTRDELASLLGAFNGLAAGSSFLHSCACSTGGRADTFTMDWLMLQGYQIMVKQLISEAGDDLTQAEKTALWTLGHSVGDATDVAKNLTQLFSQKFDMQFWNQTMYAFDIPPYEKAIAGLVVVALYAIEDKLDIDGLEELLDSLVNTLLGIFGIDPVYWQQTYLPAVKKAFDVTSICSDALGKVAELTVKFLLTFVEALVFQEQQIPVPADIRALIKTIQDSGFSSVVLSDFQMTWDYYNGFDCKARTDHANWHELAAHGLIHFVDLAEVFLTKTKRHGVC